ncbi:helix-turn-helix transcriptional regulator [Bacillaceae bacterium SIJ1]|uniref:helix-turn-helix domain-containing protein n=1 Tax=Litoribacterium kuwaitense TaxID=1398745 RepID=UPI0013EDDEC7|nr:helix-turn-helix transcriptional regulator [Litoribacterium kuwaitense]NGP46807.1 helix-turn-helix transcriptional regulator [Litoribacterium kuwaitense]
MKTSFAERLREIRKSRGWSQEELANFLKVSKATISQYETSRKTPEIQRFIYMANELNVSLDYLAGRSSAPHLPIRPADQFSRLNQYFIGKQQPSPFSPKLWGELSEKDTYAALSYLRWRLHMHRKEENNHGARRTD